MYTLQDRDKPNFVEDILVQRPSGINMEEYDRTQKMLSGFRYASDTWILLSSPGVFTIITGQPILLYALINQSNYLLPFNDCLSCIMRIGTDLRAYHYTEQVAGSRWNGDLRTYDRMTAKFLTLNPFSKTIVSWKSPVLRSSGWECLERPE